MNKLVEQLMPRIEQQFGIQLQKHQITRITDALEQIKKTSNLTDNEFLSSLSHHKKPIVDALIDAITVQESYFFRDQSLFNFLQYHYLPDLISRKLKSNNRTIRVLSAGCARGEEIYSIAILLNELLPKDENWNCYFLGVDINETALTEAAAGCYTKSSMRAIAPDIESRYFMQKENRFYLHNMIKEKVVFSNRNLAGIFCENESFDFILCRNVFIYLTQATIEHAMTQLYDCLYPHGALFLGPSDFVSYARHKFTSSMEQGVTYYRKETMAMPTPFTKPGIIAEATTPPVMPLKNPIAYIDAQEQKTIILLKIDASLKENSTEALQLIDQYVTQYPPTSLLYFYKAQALTALGDTATAIACCDLSIKMDSMSYKVYLLKGQLLLDEQTIDLAKACFKQALMIKKDCVEAEYYLGQIALNQRSIQGALLLLHSALLHAQAADENQLLFGEKTCSMKELVVAIQKDIQHGEMLKNEK
jgi:chemotaxis protein methyltransferase CheR